MRLSSLRLFRVPLRSRIVLTIAPILLAALVSLVLWIPPALRGIDEEYVPRGDPHIASQVVFFSGVGLSVLLGIGFIMTRKVATEPSRTKHGLRTKWFPLGVLLAVTWLTLAFVAFTRQDSWLISVAQTLVFLGFVVTCVLHVREIRRRRGFEHGGPADPRTR